MNALETKEKIERYTKGFLRDIAFGFAGAVSAVMGGDRKNQKWYSGKSLSLSLYMNSGALVRSFVPKNRNNYLRAEVTGNGFVVEVGSNLPYAKIHEEGGIISAKKIGKNGRKAMENFFWYAFKESKFDYYKGLALRIKKVGFVRMPARRYFSNAVKEFEKSIFPRLLTKYLNDILRIVAEGMNEK